MSRPVRGGVFVWCMVIESILGGSISALRPYLPYTAATTLGAAALIAAIAIAVSLLAERTTVRHDIT